MARWVMVVDLRKCIGCGTCIEICAQINSSCAPWRQLVDRAMEGISKDQRLFLTMSCMHCGKPPCLEVCPTRATYRRPDGIVDINYDLCVGCGGCVVACPYRARFITHADRIREEVLAGLKSLRESVPDRIGICTKCNFCLHHIDASQIKDLKPGVNPEATPICVRFCISDALEFGDLDDHESSVSKLIRENKTARLLEELGTDPSIYYILK